jgi:hypothetical protein
MSGFFYWSIVIVMAILLVKNAWTVIKFAVKAWYYIFALIIVGVLMFTLVFEFLLN